MSMSKKDFIALADALRAGLRGEKGIAEAVADACEASNPLFKRDRWLSYLAGECGPDGGEGKRARKGAPATGAGNTAKAAELADRIGEFSQASEAEEHTDTEQAWALLNDAHSLLRAIARQEAA